MIKELLEYNFNMNQTFINAMKESAFMHDDAMRFMSHILNAQLLWNARINEVKSPVTVWQIHSVTDMLKLNKEAYEASIHILENGSNLTEIKYQNSKGASFQHSPLEIQVQIANHGTHHRGQIALLMRQHHIEPPQGDYIHWKRNQTT